ncbi:MAG: M48 family metalloprotease [Leptolyngbyaceae cyanobacterium CRU_2_3]|nr:M48 family metalloprotease [Leptolyngbyaceae cyanobacterium CRU_2_3]
MTSAQTFLQAGLAALKQKDYATAIAHLEAVCQTDPSGIDPVLQARAQAGLVKAYVWQGRIEPAIAICQTLSDSPNPQARTWASQTLVDLHRRYPAAVASVSAPAVSNPDATGFIPLSPTPTSAREEIPEESPEETGHEAQPMSPLSHPAVHSKTPISLSSSLPPSALSSPFPSPSPLPTWKQSSRAQSSRAQKWGSLGALDRSTLWAVIGGTAIALIWFMRTLPLMVQNSAYWICFQIALLTPLKQIIYLVRPASDPGWGVAIALLILFVSSPWLLDRILQQFYALRPFNLVRLESHSPEAVRLLKRVCNQRGQPLPQLGLLSTVAPVALTYGYLPQNARIVVSQGLLDQLEEDEIATLYAGELGHIANWDFGVLSWLTLVAQIPYLLYWHVAAWGDRQHNRLLQTLAILVSSLGYGLYWLCRLPGLWLSRLRLYYSDRVAVELTGNPNALTRSLLKLAIGTAQIIQQWEHTSDLLESFELLTPVGYCNGLTVGSIYAQSQAQSYAQNSVVLEWERNNPYRHWLAVLNAHPPLGDRLHLLTHYAQHWRLEPELDWQAQDARSVSPTRTSIGLLRRRKFLLQAAPLIGILAGSTIAIALWLMGWLAARIDWLEWTWLAGDHSVLLGAALIGFSIGMFVRINAFFPDIQRSNLLIDPPLADLLVSETSLPVNSQPVRLQGILLGRRGIANWLHQDLTLQTQTGLIRVHHTSRWGILGDLLPQSLRPAA